MRPTDWLVQHAALLLSSGLALDVACGRGHDALWLAARGLTVRGVDRDPAAIGALNDVAAGSGLPVFGEVLDLEAGAPDFGSELLDVIVVVHYLHRPLFPALLAALRPGGVLVYETFTRAQAARGKPTNPLFLLEPGELPQLVQPLEILDAREGVFGERDVAAVVALKPRRVTGRGRRPASR